MPLLKGLRWASGHLVLVVSSVDPSPHGIQGPLVGLPQPPSLVCAAQLSEVHLSYVPSAPPGSSATGSKGHHEGLGVQRALCHQQLLVP